MGDKYYAYLNGLKKIFLCNGGRNSNHQTIPLTMSTSFPLICLRWTHLGKAASCMDLRSHWKALNVAAGVEVSS